MGPLPIGALPTGATATGAGSRRGRSAARAVLIMANVAAEASSIFMCSPFSKLCHAPKVPRHGAVSVDPNVQYFAYSGPAPPKRKFMPALITLKSLSHSERFRVAAVYCTLLLSKET